MDQLEKLKQEEAELEAAMAAQANEAQMLGNPTEEEPQQPEESDVATTEYDGEQTQDELDAAEYLEAQITSPGEEQPIDDPEDHDPEPQPQKPKRVNWKKRFTNYKTSQDATTYGLRQENLELQSQIDQLRLQMHQLTTAKQEVQGDLFEGAFTEEEEDTFGADGLDVVKKAARVAIERQIKPLKKELETQRAETLKSQAKTTHDRQVQEYHSFLGKLETLVPEYAELNTDPEFLKWIKQPDEFSGAARGDLFRKAEASRDVARVADFFMQYQAENTAVQERGGIPKHMEKHVTPTGQGGGMSTQQRQKKSEPGYYRQSDIDKFYSDMMKGRYKDEPGVIQATESAIEQAIRDKRVLKGQ